MWCIVACFIRLSKVFSLSHFAIMEISGIKHLMEDLKKKKKVHHGFLSIMNVGVSRSNVDIMH